MTKLFDQKGTHEVTRLASWAGGEYAVSLRANNLIEFRRKGTRKAFSVHLSAALNLAIIDEAFRQFEKDKQRYDERKKAGYKHLRVPKKPSLQVVFSPKFTEALKRKAI